MVCSILSLCRVLKNFGSEAVNWSVHALNRSSTFTLKNMTLQDVWKGEKPYVDHFRIFGRIAYVHISDQKRKKLDEKGEKCIFLGVSEPTKAYKLYNPITKQIVVIRDVVFDEKISWSWDSSSGDISQLIPADFNVENEVKIQQHQQQQIQDGAAPENVQ